MQVLACTNYFSQVLSSNFFIQTTFFFKNGVKLTFSAVLKNEIEVIIILIVIMQLDYIFVV